MRSHHGYLLSLAIAMLLSHSAQAEENWAAVSVEDACQMVTPKLTINDGQGDTTVWLEMTKTALVVKTGSNIDTAFKDVGLQVDQEAFIPFDEIRNETDAVFSKAIARITQEFIDGQTAQVSLRFWPTWPTTGVKTATFSLIGFTKTYQAGCKPAKPPPASADGTPEEDKQ